MITYSNLTNKSVSVLHSENGQNTRKAFYNSENGRAELQAEYPEIFEEICGEGKEWGTVATVEIIVPSEDEIKRNRIAELKGLLSSTDYQAIKLAEGEMTAEEYAPIKAQRAAYREEINELEGQN